MGDGWSWLLRALFGDRATQREPTLEDDLLRGLDFEERQGAPRFPAWDRPHDPLLVMTRFGVVRVRDGAPPERVRDASSTWGSWSQVRGGVVATARGGNPDEAPVARVRFLPTGAREGRPLPDAERVHAAPDGTAWFVLDRVARRLEPATGEVLSELTLPAGVDLVGAASRGLVLNHVDDDRAVVHDPDTGDVLPVEGHVWRVRPGHLVVTPSREKRAQPPVVLDVETGTRTPLALTDARFVSLSPDGRWVLSAEPAGEKHVTLTAVEVATGRAVTPRLSRIRRDWFTWPYVSWSRDARTAYVVPFTGQVVIWRPGETGGHAVVRWGTGLEVCAE